MKVFKDYKLGTKVFIGYGLILILLVSTFFIHLVNLYWFQDHFEKFGNIAEDQMLAGRIQANLLESRIAYENFVLFGEDAQKVIFEERINKMEEFIFELKEGINNFERAKEINGIQEHASEYKANFNKIVEYKGKRDTLYNILQLTGPQMEANATMLVEESYSSGDMIILHNSGLVLNHLLLARLNVAKFLENNNAEYIVEANKNLVALEQSINVLVSPNNSPHEKELIASLKRDKTEYEEKFNEIVTVIEDRNEVISILKENAPKISEHVENIKLSIIDEQKTYDPMIKHEIQFIIYRILILSVIGIIFAVFISIRMTRLIVRPLKTITNTFKEICEEDLRTHFLVQLNGIYQGQATGETFNGKGKTDILLRVDGENIFIAECKFWKGAETLKETLNQLLGYTTWRDTKLAMLIFNRNKKFGDVLKQIPQIIQAHPNFVRQEGIDTETQFRFVVWHPDDRDRELTLTVLAFDIPS